MINPCFICGKDWNDERVLIDTVYPQNRERTSYVFGCMFHNGGCGRQVYAESYDKVIERWNSCHVDEFLY